MFTSKRVILSLTKVNKRQRIKQRHCTIGRWRYMVNLNYLVDPLDGGAESKKSPEELNVAVVVNNRTVVD